MDGNSPSLVKKHVSACLNMSQLKCSTKLLDTSGQKPLEVNNCEETYFLAS